MRTPFRQGIVTAPPNFLSAQGSSVSLNIARPAMVTFTVADGAANYLIAERFPVANAWSGPFVPGVDYWLYWDINVRTGARTFGHTLREPIEAAVPPLNPQHDQHWFDTTTTTMKVWNSTSNQWVKRIRLFAAKLQAGTIIVSMSINAPSFIGTQVGALENIPVFSGSLMFDANGDPIKRSNGTFFTTEDVVVTGIASSSQVKVGGIVTEAVSDENIPAYSIVHFTDFHHVRLATNAMLNSGAYGIIEVDAPTGTVVNVVSSGVITNPSWDWSALGVNAPLYVSEDGTLTPNQPPNPIVVANVIDQNTIVVRPSIQTVTYGSETPLSVLEVQDNGNTVETDVTRLNFVGTTVTSSMPGSATITVQAADAFELTVSDNGVPTATAVNNIDFVGATVTSGVGGTAVVTVDQPTPYNLDVTEGGAPVVSGVTAIDFVGADVTTTEAGKATVTITQPPTYSLTVLDEDTEVQTGVTDIKFVGDNVSAAAGAAGEVVVTVTPEPAVYTYTASQDMLPSHRNAIVRFDSATPVNYTVLSNVSVSMPIGATVVLSQNGSGAVTIVPSSGAVTIVSPESLTTRKQFAKVTLTQTLVDYWEAEGNLLAAGAPTPPPEPSLVQIAPLTYADFPTGPVGHSTGSFTLTLSGDGQILYGYVQYISPDETQTTFVGRVFELGATAWVPVVDLPTSTVVGPAPVFAGVRKWGLQVATNTTGSHFAVSLEPEVVSYYSRSGATLTLQGSVTVTGTAQTTNTVAMTGDGLKLVVGNSDTSWTVTTFTRSTVSGTFTSAAADFMVDWYRSGTPTFASPRSLAISADGSTLFVAETERVSPFNPGFARYTWDGAAWVYDKTYVPTNTSESVSNGFFSTTDNGTKLAYNLYDAVGGEVGVIDTVNTTTGFLDRGDIFVVDTASSGVTQLVANETRTVISTAEPNATPSSAFTYVLQ